MLAASLALGLATSAPAFAQPLTLPAVPAGVETFTREGIQFARVRAANIPA
jgi:hypothetical protein